MRKSFFIIFVAVGLIFISGVSFSDQEKRPPKKKQHLQEKASKIAEKVSAKLEEITKELSLTPQQQIEIREILAKSRQEYMAVLRDTKIKAKEIKVKADDKIKALLTELQKAKFRETRKKNELSPRIVDD